MSLNYTPLRRGVARRLGLRLPAAPLTIYIEPNLDNWHIALWGSELAMDRLPSMTHRESGERKEEPT